MVPVPFTETSSDSSAPLVETEHLSHETPSLVRGVEELGLEIKETHSNFDKDITDESKDTSDEEEFEDVENQDTFSEEDTTVQGQSLPEFNSKEEQKYKMIQLENSELRELLGYLLPAENAANTLTSRWR